MSYAVAVGRKTGIFDTWKETESYVKGYPGAKFKKFSTRKEALEFIKSFQKPESSESSESSEDESSSDNVMYLYTDGSGKGGYGYLLVLNDEIIYEKAGLTEKFEGKITNNRAELTAIYKALKDRKVQKLIGDRKLVIRPDSEWAIKSLQGIYKNKIHTDLTDKIKILLQDMNYEFSHVYGHQSNVYNNRADELASQHSY